MPWCRSRGFRYLKQIGVDEITQFRTTWADGPLSKSKKQERLKGFFHFCVVREWTRTNPVHGMKPVKVPPSQTLPFDEDQVATLLETPGYYKCVSRSSIDAATLNASLAVCTDSLDTRSRRSGNTWKPLCGRRSVDRMPTA